MTHMSLNSCGISLEMSLRLALFISWAKGSMHFSALLTSSASFSLTFNSSFTFWNCSTSLFLLRDLNTSYILINSLFSSCVDNEVKLLRLFSQNLSSLSIPIILSTKYSLFSELISFAICWFHEFIIFSSLCSKSLSCSACSVKFSLGIYSLVCPLRC